MSETAASEMLTVPIAGLNRYKHAAYPIFSIHESETELIQDYRSVITKLHIACEEISLPGATDPEVGFVMTYMDMLKINEYLSEFCNESAVKKALGMWLQTPFSTLLPDGISIPDTCFMPIHELLQRRSNESVKHRREHSILLNVSTRRRARITVDFVKKTYHTSCDITGWKYVTILPDLSAPTEY